MAWFRRMGADEVAYHQATVVDRSDDHPGRALDYYGSRGETPLRWGGGRELAYVALSRARDHTTVLATADNLEQAVHDVQVDWSTETHQRWITDTSARPAAPVVPFEADTLDLPQRLRALTDDHHALQTGTGRWTRTPAGSAARVRNETRSQLDSASRDAQNPNLRRRDRRAATKTIDPLTAACDHAEHHWQTIGEPIAEQLRDLIATTRHDIERREMAEARQRLDRYLNRSGPEPSIDRGRDLGIGL
jgi:hypothetical protein